MRLLLDTRIYLWLITNDGRLNPAWADLIRNRTNEVHLSVVSLWEALAKHGKGKLPLPPSPAQYLLAQRSRHSMVSLPLREVEVLHISNLPMLHKDPFDRMLICQAILNGLTLVTVDEEVKRYPVTTL